MKKEILAKDNPLSPATKKAIDTILGGKVDLPKTGDTKKPMVAKDDAQYLKNKKLGTMPNEKITIKTNSGASKEIMLVREGTTDRALGELMLDANMPRERKDQIVAQYLFERGKESSSFLAELMIYKGAHSKETKVFKSQTRFDLELFMDMMVTLLNDMSGKIASDMHDKTTLVDAFTHLSVMMKEGANIITNRMNRIKEARMAEKGYGIYVDNAGRTYSVLDNDLEDIIKKDREATKEALEDNK
jgi:hypothetical protein